MTSSEEWKEGAMNLVERRMIDLEEVLRHRIFRSLPLLWRIGEDSGSEQRL